MQTTLKSIGAVLAGLLAIIILSNGTDTILELSGVFPSLAFQREHGFTEGWMVWLALSYRLLFMVAGGYITARLAPEHTLRHVFILGAIGMVIGGLGAAAAWNITPHWFSLALIALSLPSVWLGAKLLR